MTNLDDDHQPDDDRAASGYESKPSHPDTSSDEQSPRAAPYEALFPGLDKVSPSTFRKGTLSRRRINIAALVLVAIGVVAIALVVLGDALFGPR